MIRNSPVALLVAASLVACARPGTPSFDGAMLDSAIGAIAERARPGRLGVAVRAIESGETWSLEGDQRFPMQSVFKLPLGAYVLHEVDHGELSLSDTIHLTPADLSPPYSPIGQRFPERATYTIEELLVAAVGGSDNTAADVLMARVGGPAIVTGWLMEEGVRDVRIDRYEREFQLELNGMPRFDPAWAKESVFLAALERVPAEIRREATRRYLADPRDTATPIGAVLFLDALANGELLPVRTRDRLLRIATETTTGPRRLKAGLPDDATLAHKTGSARPDFGMNPAINDIGLVRLADGRQLAIAVFLSGTTLPYQEAEGIIADVMRSIMRSLR
ncbi:MAG TPA: class A beta-lactamase [Gemmatimonadaceae bacterium]